MTTGDPHKWTALSVTGSDRAPSITVADVAPINQIWEDTWAAKNSLEKAIRNTATRNARELRDQLLTHPRISSVSVSYDTRVVANDKSRVHQVLLTVTVDGKKWNFALDADVRDPSTDKGDSRELVTMIRDHIFELIAMDSNHE
tara:strand:+ start:621 stop:1052 length:432 start_codon:yes stop_codon:yes gene_type:complete